MTNSFFTKLDALLTSSTIIIDRPKGSAHPRFSHIIYPLDYGYLDGTNGGDGIDVWLGSVDTGEGEKQIVAAVATVDTLSRDAEVKVLVNCTEEEIEIVVNFITENHMGCHLIRR